jgi:DNA invertase Pin-like site-specific DNA recombinase
LSRQSEIQNAGDSYARVSTQDQDFARQVEVLEAAGASRVYSEKVSGARADRPQLARLMTAIKAGDTVMVTKIDRLGRPTRELLDLVHRISEAGASFKSLHRVHAEKPDPIKEVAADMPEVVAGH